VIGGLESGLVSSAFDMCQEVLTCTDGAERDPPLEARDARVDVRIAG
jgi:hypothetical protein